MKVFISWSGERSGKVAEQLREWLSYLFESVEPWVSRSDIEAGARWSVEVQGELAATSFGVLCLTRENVAAPWILFEAGALAKALSDTFVVPYLLDLSPSDIPSGPLSQFQAKSADRQGTWELVKGINTALKEKGREQNKLAHIFERWWPDLQIALSRISSESAPARTPRPVPDMVEEILVAVRNLERRLPPPTSTQILAEAWNQLFKVDPKNSPLGAERLDLFSGWNPEVRKKLAENIRMERVRELAKTREVDTGPQAGADPADEELDDFQPALRME